MLGLKTSVRAKDICATAADVYDAVDGIIPHVVDSYHIMCRRSSDTTSDLLQKGSIQVDKCGPLCGAVDELVSHAVDTHALMLVNHYAYRVPEGGDRNAVASLRVLLLKPPRTGPSHIRVLSIC